MPEDYRQVISYRESAKVLLIGQEIGDWKIKEKPLNIFSNEEKFKVLKF